MDKAVRDSLTEEFRLDHLSGKQVEPYVCEIGFSSKTPRLMGKLSAKGQDLPGGSLSLEVRLSESAPAGVEQGIPETYFHTTGSYPVHVIRVGTMRPR